ncbi:hypothetical protein RI129_007749 [Pyrocoelia pectoralis]|uniref:Uncharacterized protein n=1 Tax=Pyrocoelia pectoralis TaxID=417401 RepID=A0AAN7VH14_9COLE
MNRFRTTHTVIDNAHPQTCHTVRTEEVLAAVERSVEEDPNVSIRHHLALRAYKIQLVQKLKSRDHHVRRTFSEWAENKISHFWLNGYVNTQNCRIWSENNPEAFIETPLHPQKLTVWCAL